jgi:hypothetical protein
MSILAPSFPIASSLSFRDRLTLFIGQAQLLWRRARHGCHLDWRSAANLIRTVIGLSSLGAAPRSRR